MIFTLTEQETKTLSVILLLLLLGFLGMLVLPKSSELEGTEHQPSLSPIKNAN